MIGVFGSIAYISLEALNVRATAPHSDNMLASSMDTFRKKPHWSEP
jgi:hypothetical protein